MVKKGTTAKPSASSSAAGGGKPPVAPKTSRVATPEEPQGDWNRSTLTMRDKNRAIKLGLIPNDLDAVIFLGSEIRPNPPSGFTVMFLAYLFRGLSLPAHEFLRYLLLHYGLQLWQLTPNSLLHLSIFITICEAFLGIEPHFGLWKKIFFLKRQGASVVVGGVAFAVRKEVKYFSFPLCESIQGWKQKWFYLREDNAPQFQSTLPPFEDVKVIKTKKSWKNIILTEESAVVEELYGRLQELRSINGQEMLGTEFAALFVKRRIQPLQHRSHGMWLYTGATDKTRVGKDLSEKDLRDEIRRLTCLTTADDIPLDALVDAYEASHLPDTVKC